MKVKHLQVAFLALASLCFSAHVLQVQRKGDLENISERSAPERASPGTRSSRPHASCKDSRGAARHEGEWCLLGAFGNSTNKPFSCMVGKCKNGVCALEYFSECSTS
uniref:Evasin n=1 Tax=Rhipicephalus zambeziensis TaxID=60191 RepID=A0A224Y7C0_9ACAR